MLTLHFYTVVSFVLFVKAVFSAEICGIAGFQVSNLSRADYWTFTIPNENCVVFGGTVKCSYKISFCKPVPFENCQAKNSGTCQEQIPDEGSGNWTSLGAYAENPFILDGGVDDGFAAIFKNGDNTTDGNGKTCKLQTKFRFTCDHSAIWEPNPNSGTVPSLIKVPVEAEYNALNCLATFTAVYAGACYSSGKSNKMSGGAIFFLVMLSLLVAYFILGMVYNFTRGHHGVELIPHHEFWLGLPGCIAGGCIYLASLCFCRQKSSRPPPASSGGGYEALS